MGKIKRVSTKSGNGFSLLPSEKRMKLSSFLKRFQSNQEKQEAILSGKFEFLDQYYVPLPIEEVWQELLNEPYPPSEKPEISPPSPIEEEGNPTTPEHNIGIEELESPPEDSLQEIEEVRTNDAQLELKIEHLTRQHQERIEELKKEIALLQQTSSEREESVQDLQGKRQALQRKLEQTDRQKEEISEELEEWQQAMLSVTKIIETFPQGLNSGGSGLNARKAETLGTLTTFLEKIRSYAIWMDKQQPFYHLKDLIAKNKIQTVIDSIRGYTERKKHLAEFHNKVILLASQWSSLKDLTQVGIRPVNGPQIDENQIKIALITLIDEIKALEDQQVIIKEDVP